MKAVSIYETGCVRKNNEDALLVLSRVGLFAVADGMGGHNAGEVASKTAIQGLKAKSSELADLSVEEIQSWMTEAVSYANNMVYEASFQDAGNEGMGTTLTALVIRENKAVIGHVGDSRVYLWREGNLSLLSEDHSLVNELVRMGQISEERAKDHPHKNVLSRALGIEKIAEIDCFQLETQKDDVFILCTDGFSNVIEEEEMAEEFATSAEWDVHLEKLKNTVLERGAPDNFTVVCCVMER